MHPFFFHYLAKYHVSNPNEELDLLWWRTENHLYCSLHLSGSVNLPGHAYNRNFHFQIFTINTFSICPILIREVSTRNHKFLNNSVEQVSLEMERFSVGPMPFSFVHNAQTSSAVLGTISVNNSDNLINSLASDVYSKEDSRATGVEGLSLWGRLLHFDFQKHLEMGSEYLVPSRQLKPESSSQGQEPNNE